MLTQSSQTIIVAALLLLANQTLAQKCQTDYDCSTYSSWNICDTVTNKCIHKNVFPQLGVEIIGLIILVVLKILCTMAGVGGGGIVTPLCMVFYGFTTKDAVAVSAFATFAATFSSFLTSFKNRHPEKKDVVLLDYGLTCIMMPTTLSGAQIGAKILVVFPAPIIQILLTLMLIALCCQSLRKGIQIRQQENDITQMAQEKNQKRMELKTQLLVQPVALNQSMPLSPIVEQTSESKQIVRAEQLPRDKSDTDQLARRQITAGNYLFVIGENDEADKDLYKLAAIVKLEESHSQWWKWLINISLIAYLIMMNLALPTSSRPSPIGIQKCSISYWCLYVSFLFFCGLMLVLTIKLLREEQALKIKYGNINIVSSDIIFNKTNILKLISLGFFGGLLAGAFGLGGGVIFNPILLTMGLPPQVSGANSLYLVCFSKIASCLVYILNGRMNLSYAFWIGIFTSLGGVLGSLFLIIYVKYGGRQSTIVFILVVEFCISIALIPTFGAMQVKKDYDAGKNIWAFSGLC